MQHAPQTCCKNKRPQKNLWPFFIFLYSVPVGRAVKALPHAPWQIQKSKPLTKKL
ncbi:hypothetical protein HMPREF0262_01107 [Clostridium sp. ATCC 29733]|nr:hypothetical protein HMPREF0262_01107 [Clostridium sp. ATCC 29733]